MIALALTLSAACQGAVEPSDGDAPDGDAGLPPAEDAGQDAALPAEDAGEPDAAPPLDPYEVCSPDGWCFEAPYPAAEDLRGGASAGSELTVFVGLRGRVLHASAEGIRGAESGTTNDLHAVHAFSPDDVWAVGDDSTFLHFDGESWTKHVPDTGDEPLPLDDLRALWGASGQDIWAVGTPAGALWHYDGSDWVKQTSVIGRQLNGVWGASASRVFAVGAESTLLEYDGERWVASSLPGGGQPLAIHGSAADDVWVGGAGGRLWHHDGTAWTSLETPPGTAHVRAVRAISPSEVYVVGDDGSAFRGDGETWQRLTTGTTEPLHVVLKRGDELLLAGAHGTLLGFSGAERIGYGHGSRDNYLDLSAGGTGAPWVVGDSVLRLAADGPTPVSAGTDRALFGCYALDDQLAWAVGTDGTIVRWDGASMTLSDSGTDRWLRAVWAASASSAWVVGERGTVLGLFNGTSWLPSAVPSNADLFDVWGAAADDVWIAGDAGTLLHWSGSEWSAIESPSPVRLHGLWGRSSDEVWVVGASGTILQWNGAAIEVAQEGDSYALYGVWGDDEATYAVGSGGTVLRHDGESWLPEQTPTDVTLFGVGRGSDGGLRAVGADGVILIKR